MRNRACLLLAAMALAAVVGLATHAPARANGVPQLVKLTYLDGVSNWGPKNAEGVLEFSFAEAYARVEVKNLSPVDGYVLDGWLLGGSAAPFYVGPIPVQPSGVGAVEMKLKDLKSYDYNLFVVTARTQGAEAATMPAEKSIAGRFAVIGDGTATAQSGDSRPGVLPDTGEAPPGTAWKRIGLTAGAMALTALGLGLALHARRRKRQ
ncbi:MAG: hypothetical protein IT304_04515 [Dehalococcoidia bacterium]|nr:hypothetical protein [Dehalococcoidia bacterium]